MKVCAPNQPPHCTNQPPAAVLFYPGFGLFSRPGFGILQENGDETRDGNYDRDTGFGDLTTGNREIMMSL